MLSIGDLSRHTGVKVPTIRYYEQMGLLPAAERSEGNQRRYDVDDRQRLSFIKHARDLGFRIEAVRDLLALNDEPDHSCANAHDIATMQLRIVREKIERLKVLEHELGRISAITHKGDQIRDCSLIRALADHSLCNCDH